MTTPDQTAELTPGIVERTGPSHLLSVERDALDKLRQAKRGTEGWLGFTLSLYLIFVAGVVGFFFSEPLVAVALLGQLTDANSSPTTIFAILLIGLAGSLLFSGLVATFALTRIDNLRQQIEDRLARIAFIEIAGGSSKPISLYLRAFDTTGQIRSGNQKTFGARYAAVVSYACSEIWARVRRLRTDRSEKYAQLFVNRRNHSEIESAISYDIREEMPLVALGIPDRKDGAGKVTTSDQDWQETVALLIAKADRIFCVPDDNPGTLWEVSQLKTLGAIERTIFIMPSSKMLPARSETFPVEWARMSELVLNEGLTFPNYDPAGKFFGINSSGTVDYTTSFSLGSRGTFRYLHDEMERQRRPSEELEKESLERRRWRRGR